MHGIQGEVDKFDEVEYNILCICSFFFFLEKVLRAFYQLFKMIHDHTQKKHKKFMRLCTLVEEEGWE